MTSLRKYGLILLLGVSLVANGFLYLNLKEANLKIVDTNTMISTQVEKGLRQSVAYITELQENQSLQTMQNLQRTVQDLAVAFRHWLELNQTERDPNIPMEKAVLAIESLRNAIVHHLNNQYVVHDHQLNEYDKVFLTRAQESLNSYLLVYENIKASVAQLQENTAPDFGLGQTAENLEEIARLYRHSTIPNQHPVYIPYDQAVTAAIEAYPQLKSYQILDGSDTPQIKEGVHYYSLNYYDENEEEINFTIWVDAIDGTVRNYELKEPTFAGGLIDEEEAIQIAREYVANYYEGQLQEEMYNIKMESNANESVYAFRFTPVIDEVAMVSDAYSINIAAEGSLIKYTNDFTGTPVPSLEEKVTAEQVLADNQEAFPNLEYHGVSVIRVFLTNYQPKAVYCYQTIQNDQQLLVFFDMVTGKELHQLYYIYNSIES